MGVIVGRKRRKLDVVEQVLVGLYRYHKRQQDDELAMWTMVLLQAWGDAYYPDKGNMSQQDQKDTVSFWEDDEWRESRHIICKLVGLPPKWIENRFVWKRGILF